MSHLKSLTTLPLTSLLGLLLLIGCQAGDEKGVSKKVQAGKHIEQSAKPANKPTNSVQQAPLKTSPFRDETAASGLDFVHDRGATGRLYMPEIMGAGAALIDIDNDGDLDVYFVQGGPIDAEGLPTSDQIFRNDLSSSSGDTAELKFTNITQAAGIPAGGYGMGVATGDIDGDGNSDLYVSNFGPNRLLKSNGDGSFEEVTESSGTQDNRWTVPTTFFDMDADGDMDLFSGSYVDFRIANHRDCFSSTGLPDYCSPHSYNAVTDRLFENQGDGTFADVSASSGIRNVPSKGLGVISGDYNLDGWTDLYVANDGVANQLWLNQGDGTFVDDALFAGCALNYEGLPEASMGVDTADVDADGDEDIFMTHLRGETNTLYLNHGDGTFEDRTIRMGLAGPSIPYTGFGTAWIDIENDGKLDLLAVNGAVTLEEHLVKENDPFPYHQPNQLFRNLSVGDSLRFEPYPKSENDPFAVSHVSRGAAFGDLDNDGDVDVVISNNSGPARLLINTVGQDNDWLGFKLSLNDNGTQALGAAVQVSTPSGLTMMRRVRTSGSYVSANDPRVLFGLGSLETGVELEAIVTWVGGEKETFGPFAIGQYHEITKGKGRAVSDQGKSQ